MAHSRNAAAARVVANARIIGSLLPPSRSIATRALRRDANYTSPARSQVVPLTRRQLLERIAATGGATMAHEAMTALGLLAPPAQDRFDLRGQVSSVRVVILGAGLAGLTAAYELGKLGYTCQILEARSRPGGRVFTVRRGTASEEPGSSQIC